ncbi:hypothetical protein HDU83_001589 [Entophlyctis luteolus]|nr:hypothetical protein HDU83_001589 [Entophlyctis luteolus]
MSGAWAHVAPAALPFMLVCVLAAALGFLPNDLIARVLPVAAIGDKLLHFVVFALLAFTLTPLVVRILHMRSLRVLVVPVQIQPRLRRRIAREWAALASSAALIAAACVFSEMLQAVLTTRSFDINDVASNMAGAVGGLALSACRTVRRRFPSNKRRRRFVRRRQRPNGSHGERQRVFGGSLQLSLSPERWGAGSAGSASNDALDMSELGVVADSETFEGLDDLGEEDDEDDDDLE